MTMNRRHKAILFVTLVLTGSSLLAGATLNEGFGMAMLGAAFAWLVGSDTAGRTFEYLRKLPGKSWSWVRTLVLVALAGCLFVAVAVTSNYNLFQSCAAMSIFAMLLSRLLRFPTQRAWLNVIAWVLAIFVFFLASVGTATLMGAPQEDAQLLGGLMIYGLVALAIGASWLAKGWQLIQAGIQPESTPHDIDNNSERKRTLWLYIALVLGTVFLTLCLGLLTFSAFSDSAYGTRFKEPQNRLTPITSIVAFILLAWWPYGCWKKILEREPNGEFVSLRRHKRFTIALGAFFTFVLCIAITFGIQNGHDRQATTRIEESTKDFKDIAEKIGKIKSRDMRTTQDYIDAYSEIDPLLTEFDRKLHTFTDILAQTRERDKTRGPINIHLLYGKKEQEWITWDEQLFALLSQDCELTKKQVFVTKQMASLPETDQVNFWNQNFRPLAEEESTIRVKFASMQKNMPGAAHD
jgi:hypothetical protein